VFFVRAGELSFFSYRFCGFDLSRTPERIPCNLERPYCLYTHAIFTPLRHLRWTTSTTFSVCLLPPSHVQLTDFGCFTPNTAGYSLGFLFSSALPVCFSSPRCLSRNNQRLIALSLSSAMVKEAALNLPVSLAISNFSLSYFFRRLLGHSPFHDQADAFLLFSVRARF